MALKEKLTALLTAPESGITDPEFDLEVTPTGKVGGFVVSPTFSGKTQLERQNMVWDYIDGHLDKDDILRIVSLVTVTPEEMEED
jgi:tRNA-dihydrouridine synthase